MHSSNCLDLLYVCVLVFQATALKFNRVTSSTTGFTESDCHELYKKAIDEGPSVTLHIAKAMTIGPPRAGKTSFRHLLLGQPLPEVSTSTDVMKTAEIVNLNTDSKFFQIQNEDTWVTVNEVDGLHSILSHLKQKVEKANAGDDTVVQEVTKVKHADSVQAPTEVIEPQALLHLAHSSDLPTTSEPEQHMVKQPITPISIGEDGSLASTAAKEVFNILQSSNFSKITIDNAKLLQFLDCGGQLAYLDILPIFTTIPAIYIHVFDLSQGLDACPMDQICLHKEQGEVYSRDQSPLSVCEMMSQSVMNIEALAHRKVQLPDGVMLSEHPQPHIVFVGTHLDELAMKSPKNDFRATFDGTNIRLKSVLQSKSVERMVVRNSKRKLPAMFFPVACKQNIHSDEYSLFSVTELKTRTKQFVSDVKVQVPVKWYVYQMLQLSHNKEKRTPVHLYGNLYRYCFNTGVVKGVKEFHTMVTYFHALGLLIHVCTDDDIHNEDSTCHVFTNPSYLFENISKLFRVQFMDEDRCEGSLRLLKLMGKLQTKALRELDVDDTHLDYNTFMNVLVHFFIGADIVGSRDRTLFIPSVLPIVPASKQVAPKQSLHYAITFLNQNGDSHDKRDSFLPCGVYIGVIARLQSVEHWEIIDYESMSRLNASFRIKAESTFAYLFNCSSHIRVELENCDGQKARIYRDTVLTAVAKSYCFLYHAKPTKGKPCETCQEHPLLELGQTCSHCEKPSHIAKLEVVCGEAKTVCCPRKAKLTELCREQQELFGDLQHDVSVYVLRNTARTIERMCSYL